MNRLSSLLVAVFLAAGCAPASPEQTAIRGAAAALGGADRLLALKSMTLEGSGVAPNAGQNRMPDDELPGLEGQRIHADRRFVEWPHPRPPGA